MSPKKALLILSPFIVLLILTIVMVFFNQTKKPTAQTPVKTETKKETTGQNTSTENPTVLEAKIQEKMVDKKKEIEQKPATERFSQDELDFLANPRKATEKELINENKPTTPTSTP